MPAASRDSPAGAEVGAEERRAKANRLLSRVTAEVQCLGLQFELRRLFRALGDLGGLSNYDSVFAFKKQVESSSGPGTDKAFRREG